VVVLAEAGATMTRIVPDAVGWTNRGTSMLIECKVSVSDFYADRRKPGSRVGYRVGAQRFYMTPPGLLKPDLIPSDWGLLEVHPKSVRKVKEAPPVLLDRWCVRQEMIILLAEMRRIAGGWRKNPSDKNYQVGQVGVQYAAELEKTDG
jgi:hypothetical protein